MKKTILMFLAVTAVLFSGCGNSHNRNTTAETTNNTTEVSESVEQTEEPTALEETDADTELFTIVYTNDIHGYIGNKKDENSEDDVLRLSNVSKMVKDMRADGRNVILVDAGDEFQGATYAAIDEGKSISKLMNAAGYEVATIGNHEFDYGANRLFQLVDMATYDFITCNFHTIDPEATGDPFETAKLVTLGDTVVAFIGITTPETITTSSPVYFQNEKGEYIYAIDGSEAPEDLYNSVQTAIDSVRDKADFVIALGHVGIDLGAQNKHISSIDIIQNTTGLDAFIDGHSHSTISGENIKDKEGKQVVLTQTGCYLNAVGIMEVDKEGSITTSLVNSYEGVDEEVAAIENQLIETVNTELGKKIAEVGPELYISNPDNPDQRLIRSMEMNLGDLFADAFYWNFNKKIQLDCDIAIINGGDIRSGLAPGDVTMNDLKSVNPFGNMICLISATGQQIKDALEKGAAVAGDWDDQSNRPAENGGFLHVAGLRYTIDPNVASTVQTDSNNMFLSVEGDYRVKDVEVYNKDTQEYEPLVLEQTYTVGGTNYILRNSGDGFSMFDTCDMVVDYVGEDCNILSDYLESFAKSGNYALVNTENSPLKEFTGYMLDYDNPFGSGRINILA